MKTITRRKRVTEVLSGLSWTTKACRMPILMETWDHTITQGELILDYRRRQWQVTDLALALPVLEANYGMVTLHVFQEGER